MEKEKVISGLITLEEFKKIDDFMLEVTELRNKEFQTAGTNTEMCLQIAVNYINDYGKVISRIMRHLETQAKQKQLH